MVCIFTCSCQFWVEKHKFWLLWKCMFRTKTTANHVWEQLVIVLKMISGKINVIKNHFGIDFTQNSHMDMRKYFPANPFAVEQTIECNLLWYGSNGRKTTSHISTWEFYVLRISATVILTILHIILHEFHIVGYFKPLTTDMSWKKIQSSRISHFAYLNIVNPSDKYIKYVQYKFT